MATHSSVLAWRIPGMGEPGGLPSVGSHKVGHDWSNLAAADHGSNRGSGKTVPRLSGLSILKILFHLVLYSMLLLLLSCFSRVRLYATP